MPTTVRNKTSEEIVIIDRYLTEVSSNSGYDGPLGYLILPGEKEHISYSKYLKQAMEERKTQKIDVRISGETKLELQRENFKDKKKEVIFEMHNGSLSVKYSAKTRTTWADSIRRIFPFCRARFNAESPVTPQ